MGKSASTGGEVVCPNCGHRFRLTDQVTAPLHEEWEKRERARLRQELRADADAKAEQRVRGEYEAQLRDKDEEIRVRDRKLRRLERQAAQRPSQELGIVRQATLQELLAARFPHDDFEPVATGKKGADLLEVVRDGSGQRCGAILWEAKRGYESWSKSWLTKLRADQRRVGSDLAVIVSDVLPDRAASFCDVGGSVACELELAPYVAMLLRERLIEVAGVRGTRARRDDLKGAVYDFVSGPFIDGVRSMMEKIVSMKETLDRERRAKAADWKQRETEIEGVALDLASMYGALRGIGASLPPVPHLEPPGAPPALSGAES